MGQQYKWGHVLMKQTSTPRRALGTDLPQQRDGAIPGVALHAGRVLVAEDSARQSPASRGERLHHLFEQCCDWIREHGPPDHLAVDADGLALTFDELDARAN